MSIKIRMNKNILEYYTAVKMDVLLLLHTSTCMNITNKLENKKATEEYVEHDLA